MSDNLLYNFTFHELFHVLYRCIKIFLQRKVILYDHPQNMGQIETYNLTKLSTYVFTQGVPKTNVISKVCDRGNLTLLTKWSLKLERRPYK